MQNRHLVRYYRIINHYASTVVEGYVERHHIIPKCMGGSDDFNNLVALPPKAHIICHYLLYKAYPENISLSHAFSMMAVNNKNQNRIFSSRMFQESKIARSNALKGVPRTEETKAKMRKPKLDKSNYSNAKSETHKKNISSALKGKTKDSDHLKKIRESMSNHYNKTKKDTEDKKLKHREEFIASKMSRKQFAEYKKINYSTLKKYLKGL